MKDAIPADRPLSEIDPKAYLYGADAVALTRAADRASEEYDVTMVFTSPILEARAVVGSVEYILVCAPHLDPIRPDRGVTDILPEALIEARVRMMMLNHAEYPIAFTVLEKTTQHATEIGLAATVCASSLAETRAVASLGSDLLVAEPTELIGAGKPSGFDYVETSNHTAHEINPGVCVLQGAGISTPVDVEAVIRNGADVTGSSSTITIAPDPSATAEVMIRMARRGWDARPRPRRSIIVTEKEETMKVYREMTDLQSTRNHPTFHDVTKEVGAALRRSGVKDGITAVYNHHTTCSILTQECSHDKTYCGLEYLQQDLVNTMERIVPRCLVEGQYIYPGSTHIRLAMGETKEEDEWISLNTDAHLCSVSFGRPEAIAVVGSELDLGEFGYICFVSWDQIRDRSRQCRIQITGE